MKEVFISVNPGICGFDCKIHAEQSGKRLARIAITGSDCVMIQKLSENLPEIHLQDLFVPLTRNSIFLGAEKAGCHLACPVPVAIVKACEAALGLAVKKDAAICFPDANSLSIK